MSTASTVTVTAAATDSTCSVSTVASVSSTSGASTASVPKSKNKKPRSVTANVFRKHLAKYYSPVEIPSFDNVTGKEWDSRARAYIRQQIRSIIDDKWLGFTNRDLATWTKDDLVEPSNDIC